MTVSDLTGTTWLIDETPTLYTNYGDIVVSNGREILFTSNSESHSRIVPANYSTLVGLYYGELGSSPVYTPTGGWVDEAYRTITFTGGTGATNSTLISWLEANATQVVKYPNKFVIDGVTKLDLTADTALASDVASGKYFHLATGERVQGGLANGNSIEYGITDGTLPLVGVAKVGYAVI